MQCWIKQDLVLITLVSTNNPSQKSVVLEYFVKTKKAHSSMVFINWWKTELFLTIRIRASFEIIIILDVHKIVNGLQHFYRKCRILLKCSINAVVYMCNSFLLTCSNIRLHKNQSPPIISLVISLLFSTFTCRQVIDIL